MTGAGWGIDLKGVFLFHKKRDEAVAGLIPGCGL